MCSVIYSACVCVCLQFRMEPGQMVQESYTVEEDPQESPPVVSLETSDDGTTRRTETTVTWVDGKCVFAQWPVDVFKY